MSVGPVWRCLMQMIAFTLDVSDHFHIMCACGVLLPRCSLSSYDHFS